MDMDNTSDTELSPDVLSSSVDPSTPPPSPQTDYIHPEKEYLAPLFPDDLQRNGALTPSAPQITESLILVLSERSEEIQNCERGEEDKDIPAAEGGQQDEVIPRDETVSTQLSDKDEDHTLPETADTLNSSTNEQTQIDCLHLESPTVPIDAVSNASVADSKPPEEDLELDPETTLKTVVQDPDGKTVEDDSGADSTKPPEEDLELDPDTTLKTVVQDPDGKTVEDDNNGGDDRISSLDNNSPLPSEEVEESGEEIMVDKDPPRLSSACRYRWSNILDTTTSDVGFFPSYAPRDPILLSWNENANAYFSSELRIVCGDYHGNLVVDGKDYDIEEFSVRSYSFEIDLYIKEDVLEDETPAVESQHKEANLERDFTDQARATSDESRSNSRNEDFSKQKVPDLDSPKIVSDETLSTTKRHSPVGVDSSQSFTEVQSVEHTFSDQGAFEKPPHLDQQRTNRDVVEDIVVGRPGSQLFSHHNSDRNELVNDVSSRTLSVNSSHQGSVHDSGRQSPTSDNIYGRPDSRSSARFKPVHNEATDDAQPTQPSRSTPLSDMDKRPSPVTSPFVDQRAGSGLRQMLLNDPDNRPSSGLRQSPQRDPGDRPGSASSKRSLNDTGNRPGSASSRRSLNDSGDRPGSAGSRRSLNDTGDRPGSASRRTPLVEVTDVRAYMSPKHISPVQGTPSRLSEAGRRELSQENVGEAATGQSSHPDSHVSSRPQSVGSVSSELELSQYINSRCDSLGPPGGESHPDESAADPAIFQRSDRANSVPLYDTQYQPVEKRSLTPDNRVRVLPPSNPLRNKLSSERSEEVRVRSSSVASNASSRTITPVGDRTLERDTERIQDLEKSVTNLRKMLTSRETEVHSLSAQVEDLRDINRALKEDIEHRGKRHTPVSTETSEFKQLQSEKDILVKEVVALREEIAKLTTGQGSGRNSASSAISDYSPNHPNVLQRKIADLEGHLRDVHEANETTTASLARAEQKVHQLLEENKQLREGRLRINDHTPESSDQHLRVELLTLQEDVKSLKDRNYHLMEENLRLRECSKDGVIYSSMAPRLSSSLRSDTREARDTYTEESHRTSRDTPPPHPHSTRHSSKLYREDLAPKQLLYPFNRSFDSDSRLQETKLLQERDRMEAARIRNYSRGETTSSNLRNLDSSTSGVSYSAMKNGFSYSEDRRSLTHRDRSRPDGEVADNVYSDRFSNTKAADGYERKLTDSHVMDQKSTSIIRQTDRQSGRPSKSYEDGYDKYKQAKATLDKEYRSSYPSQAFTAGTAINSSDIFLHLQKKRAAQWSLRENRSPSVIMGSDDYDSDSTAVLMTTEPTGRPSREGRTMRKERDHFVIDKYISGNLDFEQLSGKVDEAGDDDSDTATDILLAHDTTPRGLSNGRRNSLDSDGSVSPISDIEEATDRTLHRRSKSVDRDSSRSVRSSSTLPRTGSATRPLNSLDSMRKSTGHRSVLPAPLITQHNKGELAKKGGPAHFNSTLTNGLRPFAPRNAADIRPEDVVKFSRVGGKLTLGIVKYIGHLPGRSEVYLGVELDKDEGKHDGTFEGIRYYKCKPNKGVFVAFNKIVMAWAP